MMLYNQRLENYSMGMFFVIFFLFVRFRKGVNHILSIYLHLHTSYNSNQKQTSVNLVKMLFVFYNKKNHTTVNFRDFLSILNYYFHQHIRANIYPYLIYVCKKFHHVFTKATVEVQQCKLTNSFLKD